MVMFEMFKIPPAANSKSCAEAACSQRRARDGDERQAGRDSVRCVQSQRGGGSRKVSIKPLELKCHGTSKQPEAH